MAFLCNQQQAHFFENPSCQNISLCFTIRNFSYCENHALYWARQFIPTRYLVLQLCKDDCFCNYANAFACFTGPPVLFPKKAPDPAIYKLDDHPPWISFAG